MSNRNSRGIAEPDDEVTREAIMAMDGYTMSIAKKAVFGRSKHGYFMTSGGGTRRKTLPVEETSLEQLASCWRAFRSAALLETGLPDQPGGKGTT